MSNQPPIVSPGLSNVSIGELVYSWHILLKFLLRKWYIIFIAAVVGGLLGIVWAWQQKPKYTSSQTFALEDNKGALGGALSIAAEFGFNVGGGNDVFAGENILLILTTRDLIEKVLLAPDTTGKTIQPLIETWLSVNGTKEKLKKHPRLGGVGFKLGVQRSDFSYIQDSLLFLVYSDIVKTHLDVSKPDKKLNIYQVLFTSQDERFSKIFNERLVQATIHFYTELRSKRSKETLEILENRVAQLKGSVNSAIDNRATVQDANVNPAFAQAQAPLQRKQIDISVYGTAYTELFKNLELARYQYLKDIPLLQILESPRYPLEFNKPGKLKTGLLVGFIFAALATFILAIPVYNKKLKQDTTA